MTNDISAYDSSQYQVWLEPPGTRFHLGEPITVQWRAPPTHSKRDWVGIYRVGLRGPLGDTPADAPGPPQKRANNAPKVTKTSCLGLWVPVHDDEWDGDIPLDDDGSRSSPKDSGEVVFRGDTLPWVAGEYEVRRRLVRSAPRAH